MKLRNGMDINFTVNKIHIYACCAKTPDPVVTSFGNMPSRRACCHVRSSVSTSGLLPCCIAGWILPKGRMIAPRLRSDEWAAGPRCGVRCVVASSNRIGADKIAYGQRRRRH